MIKIRHKRFFHVFLLAGTLLLGVLAGFWMPRDDDFFALRKSYQIFSSIYEELIGGYVDPLDPEKLMRTGLDAMLRDLDPYTSYYDEADQGDLDIITKGSYGGVGLNIGTRGGKITVISPVEGASGYKQGVRAGDVIVSIAGKSTKGLNLSDVRELLRGEPGTGVEIVVTREGTAEPLHFLLTREEVQLKNVTYAGFVNGDTTSGIGYVKLERFARGADVEVLRSIQELQQTGKLKGVVLDLRDNPGGLLEAAVRISQLFVPQGSLIVSTRGRLADTDRMYRSQAAPTFPDLPLVVLVNNLSASASEIVAGAIQDLDRGVIIGTPSYGKGLVQVIKPMPYNTSLKMTTSRYYTPSGRSIQAIDYGNHDGSRTTIPDSVRRTFHTGAGRPVLDGRGIEPDVAIPSTPPSELEEALERRAAFFFFANQYAAKHRVIPTDFTVTDAVLDEFRTWLEREQFTYRTDAERAAEELGKTLDKIGYREATDEAERLEAAIAKEKASDLERNKDRIRERLRAEIMARYFGEQAQIQASLGKDPFLAKASTVLSDSGAYSRLLSGR